MPQRSDAARGVSPAAGGDESWIAAGRPFHVADCLARLHPAGGGVGAILIGPFGYDDYALHASFRRLAELIARAGWPTLRLDAPGSGHSADPDWTGPVAQADGLAPWRAAAGAAAADFSRRAGVETLIVIGVAQGAAVALDLARAVDAAGLALLAPWTDGRRAIREYDVSSRLMLDALGVPPDPVDTPGDLLTCGFLTPAPLRTALATVKIRADDFRVVPRLLLAARPSQAEELERLAREVGSFAGLHATALNMKGYDEASFDPSAPRMSDEALAPIVAWVDETARACDTPPARPIADWTAGRLDGAGFVETALRFGAGERLFGVLCRPIAGTPRAGVLLLTSGRGRSVGWARAEVDEARRLARAGVASLRFDMAGVGDSVPDGPGEPLYDKARTVDVRDAVDALLAVGIGPVALYGRCSGAFLGFAALGAEPRLAGAVLCNGQRYVWRPWETVEQATKQSVRSLGALSERVFEPRQWARLMRREITPRQALTKIVGALLKRGLAFAASRGVALTPEGRLAQGVRAQFGELSRRGTPVRILISDGDRALDELRAILPTQTELERLGNVTLTMAPNADHNMTPRAARAAVGREIDALLETIAARAARG